MTTYGVVGVGSIASAIVVGLCEGVVEPPRVVLSPRNAERAADLAARFATVEVAADNQEVVDAADVLLLAILPNQTEDVLAQLRFRADQAIVSAIAGVSVGQLQSLAHPATEIARSIPLPAVAGRQSLTPVYPPIAAAVDLFDRLGGCLPVDQERAFESLSAASATVAAHFRYLGAIADWTASNGMDEASARDYVADLFASLGGELRSEHTFSELADAHSTPGGLNAQFAEHLDNVGTYTEVATGLDAILKRITGR